MSTKVSESSGYGPNTQMSLFGYIMGALLVIVLLPLIPVLVPVWILWKLFVSEDEFEHGFENWRRESGRTGSDRLEAAETEPADTNAEDTEAEDTETEDADPADAEADQTAAES